MSLSGTCKSGIFVRIESRIESADTIRIELRIESGCSRLRVQCRLPQELCENEVIIIITDEQRCADSPGSSNNIA